jgi:hypothetical protein
VIQKDWDDLLERIADRECTAFLGAGVNDGLIPLGGEIAQGWATEHSYPLNTSSELDQVSQFIAVTNDPMKPKQLIQDLMNKSNRLSLSDPRLECLKTLAELPLPVYITTNYDELMKRALERTDLGKKPISEYCRWHKALPKLDNDFYQRYEPDKNNPLVFHLHGIHNILESIVLTEDDYLDFIVNLSLDGKILPPCVLIALARPSLLFIGYSLRDISYRLIHRGFSGLVDTSRRARSVTVQLEPPPHPEGRFDDAKKYMGDYFQLMNISVYWGTASAFAKELKDRWNMFSLSDNVLHTHSLTQEDNI